MARSLFSTETQRRLNEDDRRWRLKLGLRAFATLLALPATLLFAASTSLSKLDYGGDDWVDAMPLAPVLLALLYNPVHILLTTHPTLHRPIHPAWPLTIDLFIWALSLPSLVFSVGDGWFWYWQPVELSIDGDFVLCDFSFNFWSEPCNPAIYTLGKMEIAANVFLALILIAHFILFIYSCVAVHHHRKSRARTARERRNIELQYHRDPESHRASAMPAPPTYTQSTLTSSPHHKPRASIAKSARSSSSITEEKPPGPQPLKSLEAGQSPPASPLHPHGTPGWNRNVPDLAPRLASPISPVNSGSGGGFMDEEMGGGGVFRSHHASDRTITDAATTAPVAAVAATRGKMEEEGPFGDHAAVRYA